MIIKSNILKTYLAIIFTSIILLSACKKDKLTVNQEKRFLQENFNFDPSFPFNAGWQLTLMPDGVADVIPGGDIIYRGTYKISGSLLTFKSDDVSYKFDIINQKKIKEKSSGTILLLK